MSGFVPAAVALVLAGVWLQVGAGPSICFREMAQEAGLRFTLENGATPEKHLIESMPGGLVIFDYDGDGRPDVFFTNGAAVASLKKSDAKFRNRLFHNEGGMRFRDVTDDSGLAGEGYSMGAAVGDFDNDGYPDLFVAGVRENHMYRNLGNGKFADVTAKSGIKSDQWSVTGGFFDFDGDGKLDLFVVNYGQWDASTERYCGDQTKQLRVYCHPKYYNPRPNQLYRNRGDGTFEDVSSKSGISVQLGRGMGIAFADYDRDGKSDVFITNDNLANFLFHNVGGGRFEEVALTAGVALPDAGKPIASMGTDFRDYDNDGWPDLVVVGLTGETFPLFHNEKDGSFRDVTHASKMASLSRTRAGWGAVLADFDNDGWKDVFTSNSHVNDVVEKFEPTTYRQANSVFANAGSGTFALADCPALRDRVQAHRGLAVADLNGDGKLDVIVTALGAPAELWQNTSAGANHWLTVKLKGVQSNRDGIGAIVRLGNQTQEMWAPQGYLSASLAGLHFGLGDATKVSSIEIRWPSGKVQAVKDVTSVDRVLTVTEE